MRKLKEYVSDVPRLMKEWDFEENEHRGIFPDKLGSQSNTYAYWKCQYGHRWKAKINNRYKSCGCPECRKGKKTSFPEQAIYFYVSMLYPDAINSYKDIFAKGMELDVFIPSLHLGIEYDGAAWHGESSHDREVRKYEICKQKNIKLIRFREKSSLDEQGISDLIIKLEKPFISDSRSYRCLDNAIQSLFCDYLKVSADINTKRDKNLILSSYLTIKTNSSLGHMNPELARLWHPTKNGLLTPYMFSSGSNIRVWWKGDCGHEWESAITTMNSGRGCPFCAGQKVLQGFNDLKTVRPDIAAQWHPTKNGDKKPEMYTYGSGAFVYWQCPICKQSWRARINMRTSANRGCPYCAHILPIKGENDLAAVRPDLLKEWAWEKNVGLDPHDFLPNSNRQVWWKCEKCGYEYKAAISNRNKGTGCHRCAGMVVIPGENDLKALYPQLAEEWDYEKNAPIKPEDILPGSNKKFYWKCKYGHSWMTSANQRTSRKTNCPYCSGNKVLSGFNDIATTHPDIAKEWHPTKNDGLLPTMVSKGYIKKVWFLCKACGSAYQSYIGNKIKGYGKCPYCNPRRRNHK